MDGTSPRCPPCPDGTNAWPRITIVTAVYNGEAYLEDTVRSILHQGYPNLEYIIVDDGSTDGTANIIKRYEQHFACRFSQPNRGLYHALNAGFRQSTGEIMGWLNASDRLHEGGLFVVGTVFAEFPEVEWVTGRPTVVDPLGMTVQIQRLPRWSHYRFLAGANRHIQQESTFWRRRLWERAGGTLSTDYRAEGDFELWLRFFRHARLYSVNALIGGYRMHANSLSHANLEHYNNRCDEILDNELQSVRGRKWIKLFRRATKTAVQIPKVRWAWRQFVMQSMYRWPAPDWAPVIEYHVNEGRWVIHG